MTSICITSGHWSSIKSRLLLIEIYHFLKEWCFLNVLVWNITRKKYIRKMQVDLLHRTCGHCLCNGLGYSEWDESRYSSLAKYHNHIVAEISVVLILFYPPFLVLQCTSGSFLSIVVPQEEVMTCRKQWLSHIVIQQYSLLQIWFSVELNWFFAYGFQMWWSWV